MPTKEPIINRNQIIYRTPDEVIFTHRRQDQCRRLTSPHNAKPTPEPTIQTGTNLPPFGTDEWWAYLEEWHKQHNGE